MWRCLPFMLLAAAIVVPAARAQQPETKVVLLQSQDKAMVGTTPLATKDIVAHLAGQFPGRGWLSMVEIRSCKGVPADTTQALMQDLQKRNYMVVIDLKDPDARLCVGTAVADAVSVCASSASKPDLDQRIASCSEAITQNAVDKARLAIAYNLRGSAFAQKGDFGRAILDLTKGIELGSAEPVVYAARGEAYRRKGELDRAIADFNKVIEIVPKHPTAYHTRGLAYAAKRDSNRAIADLSKAIENNPKSAMAFHDRALIYENLGQKDKAIADHRSALQLDPKQKGSEEALRRLGAPAP